MACLFVCQTVVLLSPSLLWNIEFQDSLLSCLFWCYIQVWFDCLKFDTVNHTQHTVLLNLVSNRWLDSGMMFNSFQHSYLLSKVIVSFVSDWTVRHDNNPGKFLLRIIKDHVSRLDFSVNCLLVITANSIKFSRCHGPDLSWHLLRGFWMNNILIAGS